MRNWQENEKHQRSVRKSGVTRPAQHSPPKPKKQSAERPTVPEATTSSRRLALTQEELRARISRQAFELYEKRRTATEVDDWIEAERLVKIELLSEEQGVGSV